MRLLGATARSLGDAGEVAGAWGKGRTPRGRGGARRGKSGGSGKGWGPEGGSRVVAGGKGRGGGGAEVRRVLSTTANELPGRLQPPAGDTERARRSGPLGVYSLVGETKHTH